jgi:haloalkane dehalogenase
VLLARATAPPLPDFIARELPFARALVDVGGIRLHVAEHGEGDPVLLLHGNPTWCFLWRKVARALAGERLRLVMPDLAGLGLSDKPRDLSFHTLPRHAGLVRALADGLGIGSVVLVLHDWGGPIGLHAFADAPERVTGLVLTNTGIGPPRHGSRGTAFHRFARRPVLSDLAFRVLGFPQIALSRAQGDPRSIRGDVARAYRWPLRRIRDRTAPLALARLVPSGPGDPVLPDLARVRAFAEALRVPVALVWGERDPILGRALGRVASVFPNAEVTATAAGHFLQEEVPEAIARAIAHVARSAR